MFLLSFDVAQLAAHTNTKAGVKRATHDDGVLATGLLTCPFFLLF